MKFPESRTFRPDYGIKGPSRRAHIRRRERLALLAGVCLCIAVAIAVFY